jgi:hypothetical protein
MGWWFGGSGKLRFFFWWSEQTFFCPVHDFSHLPPVSGCWTYIVLVQKHPLAGPLIAVQFSGENKNLWLTGFVTALTYVFFLETSIFFRLLEHRFFKKLVLKSQTPRLPKPPTHTTT